MGLLGTLLSAPFKIVNATLRAMENLVNGNDPMPESDRIFSKPLDILADELEDLDE